MPVIMQRFIHRDDLRDNRDVLYVFGDNMQKFGLGGQAKNMRGEPNAVGIPTKWAPHMHAHAFFNDKDDLSEPLQRVRDEFVKLRQHLAKGGIVVLPSDGIGVGLARLNITAPKFLAIIEAEVQSLRLVTGG